MDYPQRKHPRLKEFDYSREGLYFLTLCSKEKHCVFSQIVGRGILDAPLLRLTEYGVLAENACLFFHKNIPNVTIDKYVIMPNHVHLIVGVA